MSNKSEHKGRLFWVKEILMRKTDEEHALTVYEIIEELKRYGITAERRTIAGDMEDLMLYGTQVVKEKDGKRIAYKVVDRDFETAELKLIVDAIQSSRFLTEKKTQELIRKISGLTSDYEARKLKREVIVQGRDKYSNEMIYCNVDQIHRAMATCRKITFEYLTWNTDRKLVSKGTYALSPWALIWSDEKYYVVGYDSDRRDRRHFRVDKMKNTTITNQLREGSIFFTKEELAKYTQRYFGMFGGKETKVRLRFKEDKVGILFDHFGTKIPIWKGEEPGWSETEVCVVVSGQFYGWMFSLGDVVRLTGPEEVVDEYRNRLDQASIILDQQECNRCLQGTRRCLQAL